MEPKSSLVSCLKQFSFLANFAVPGDPCFASSRVLACSFTLKSWGRTEGGIANAYGGKGTECHRLLNTAFPLLWLEMYKGRR